MEATMKRKTRQEDLKLSFQKLKQKNYWSERHIPFKREFPIWKN